MTIDLRDHEVDIPGRDASVDETTALLSATSGRSSDSTASNINTPSPPKILPAVDDQSVHNDDEDEDRPLPMGQISLLCAAKMAEPIVFFSIFPFVNQMVYETGQIREEDVGFYSGLIESLFCIVQIFSMVQWGRFSDRYGRKPILIFSLVGIAIAATLFGYSKSVWEMILWRCVGGLFSGTGVTLRTMVTENSTKKTQARAFSIFGISNNLGIVIGPLIGGALAKPATTYPNVFGNVQFFKDYPYALPTTVTGGVVLVFTVFASFFIKETLTPARRDKLSEERMSVWELLKTPGVSLVLFIYNQTMFQAFAYTAVSPVFWFTRPSLGGFGFSPVWISIALGIAGVSQSAWLILAFPYLQHRFSTGWVLRACAYGWPVFMVMYPLANEFLRHNQVRFFWILFPIGLVLGSGVSMSFTAGQLALNDIAPSPAMLGTLNGIALSMNAGTRAFVPAMFTSIYALGVKGQILRGHLIWAVLVGTSIILLIAIAYLPAKAEGKLKKKDDPV